MQNLYHADLFFFVSTIGFILFGILMAVLIFYLIQVVREVRDLTRSIKEEGENILSDFRSIRETVFTGSNKVASFITQVIISAVGMKKPARKKKSKSEDETE
ncbi:MAG: hypothetical protein COV70_03545 [Parcubacteria group bacterium CG11_big_fil_rev_8_21_14_0_20_39_22]|nr:MAG: hypothetical protein COV70_03545 [Parcubacteria group bacterium CG11_big_fil_rev_8_21_14_0_20_39_22]